MPRITEERLIVLIQEYLSGSLSPEEQVLVHEWAEESEANLLLLNKMKDDSFVAQELERWKRIDPVEGHARWMHLLQARRRSKIVQMIGWAAAACLLILAGAWWLLQSRPIRILRPVPSEAANASSIQPGRNTAVLTLSNGRRIQLDSTGKGDVAIQGNVRVVKTSEGGLSYTASGNSVENAISYNTLSTPRSGQFQVLLPDGSRVWLNNASSLRYPVAFTGKDRMVELTGEAYFEITRDAVRPFVVRMKDESVEVLGTSFNVKAYPDELMIKTTLLTGSVRVKKDGTAVLLQPDEQAEGSKTNNGLTVIKGVPAVDIVSWKNGFFYFERASLQDVMQQLGRWYDIDVKYEGAIPPIEFQGKIDRNLSFKDLLEYLNQNQVRIRLEGRTIIVLPK